MKEVKNLQPGNVDENQYQSVSEDGEVLIISRFSSLRLC